VLVLVVVLDSSLERPRWIEHEDEDENEDDRETREDSLAMPAVLRIIEGPQTGATCELRQGQRVILGRGERAELPVLDSWASRSHCSVTYQPDGLVLEDLRSKNGTYLGGHRVERVRVVDGSLIQIGTTTIEVVMRPVERTVAVPALPGEGGRLRGAPAAILVALLLVGIAYGGLVVFSGGRADLGLGSGGLAGLGRRLSAGLSSLFRRGPHKTAVAITSEPSGASVFIDDEFHGTTPIENAQVALGEHPVRVQKSGYEVLRAVLAVDGSLSSPVHYVLQVSGRGALAISSRPDGASVYLDSDYRGKTPLRLENLEPHAYSVRLEMPNFADWQQQVAVKATETVAVEATLGHREIGFYLAQLKEDPNNVSYHCEVAHLYLLEHKVDEAIEQLTQAIEITIRGNDTTRPEPYTARLITLLSKIYLNDHFRYGDDAFVQMIRGRVEGMFGNVAAGNPNNGTLHQLAQQLGRQGGNRAVLNAVLLREAEGPGGGDLDQILRAVDRLEQANQYQQAETILKNALKTYPNEYRVHLRLGRVYLQAKRAGVAGAREKAIEALNAALKLCPNEAAREVVRGLLGTATR